MDENLQLFCGLAVAIFALIALAGITLMCTLFVGGF